MAEIVLAGTNLDFELIRQFKQLRTLLGNEQSLSTEMTSLLERLPEADAFTPETLSAAYARISRYPQPVTELRRIAMREVEKARKSNETIIFGLGHSSVAEHAVFNIDVMQVSRLAMEFLQRFRLTSFTEKSQRYITVEGDFVLPEEIQHSTLESLFLDTIRKQVQTYQYLYQRLREYFFSRFPDMNETPAGKRTLDGWAKEDARYALSLATTSQTGMTINARTLENMIARARSHPLKEINEIGDKLFHAIEPIAPSLVKYPEATSYFSKLERYLSGEFYQPSGDSPAAGEVYHFIRWVNENSWTEEDLDRFFHFLAQSDRLSLEALLEELQPWDALPRFTEFVDFRFEIILSAASFGQLKRHRMTSQLIQPYDPVHGITIPPSIREIGETETLREICTLSEKTFQRIYAEFPLVAPYILTNAHRRRVLVRMDFRELTHFSRLRSDAHAQWDIRFLSQELCRLVRNKFPRLGILLTGKDHFAEAIQHFKKG